MFHTHGYNFKVAGKYWRGCRSFDSLHEYEDLEQVFAGSWNEGLGRLS